MEVIEFLKAVGFMIFVLLIGGAGAYWVGVLFSKYKYHIKYKILKKKYDEATVEMLMTSINNQEDEKEFFSRIIKTGLIPIKQIKEMHFIYEQLKQRMKGGLKHE